MRSTKTAWVLLSPTLVILALVGLLPFLYVLSVSFLDWNVFGKVERVFTGADNYRRLVFDGAFLGALWRTIQFTLWAVGTELVLGYVLAQMLLRPFPGRAIFRAIHTLPLMVAPIAIGAAWRLLTIPGFGPVPYYVGRWFGLEYNIGRSADQAFFTTVVMDVWHWTPLVTLILMAGLASLPAEPFEQAQVDGATRWQMFRYITVPMLKPVILTTVFLRVMDALRVVDEVWMLTGGGPGTATRYVGIHLWRVVFPKTEYGYGSAMSVLLLYFTIVLSWLLYAAIAGKTKERD